MPRKALLTETQKQWIFGFPRALNKWKPAEKLLCFLLKQNIAHKFLKQCIPLPTSYRKFEWRIVSRRGLLFKLDLSEQVDWYNYFYLPQKGFENFLSILSNNEIIFDVGANIGTTALMLAKKCKGGFVYAFEPDPYNYNRLRENMDLNKLKNIRAYNLACSNKAGIGKLESHHPNNAGLKSIAIGNDPALTQINIITIDEFILQENVQNLTALKIDTEGHEPFVLEGGMQTLKKYKIKIFAEVNELALRNQKSSPQQLIEILNLLHYTFIKDAETGAAINLKTNFKECNFDIVCS